MRQYEFGDEVGLRHEVRNLDDELIDATVAFSVTPPSGVVASITPDHSGTGLYDVAVPADEYGPWTFTWTVSGTVTDVEIGQFYIADPVSDVPPLAPFGRLVKKLGYTPVDAERDRAESLLVEASELIRDVAGKTWLDADNALEGVPVRIANICVAVAFRAFGNPEALTQRSIGDSSKSFDRTSREGGEDVYLTKAEEAAIHRAAGTSSLVAVTLVSPYNGTYTDDAGDLVWA